MSEKILIVDDEPNVLEAFKRQLTRQFRGQSQSIEIDTALSGEDGLEMMKSKGPYAVIVSDMKMPNMDGVRFLSCVRELAPNTVRVMITGKPTMGMAMNAVNEGNVFSFLTKPCSPETLAGTLMLGIEQFRVTTTERGELEKALSGSIGVMADILNGRGTSREQATVSTPEVETVPPEFALHPNTPNPFAESTTIRYDVKEAGSVTVKVFDLFGHTIATLVDGTVAAGSHEVAWDATDLPTGIYLCMMEAEGFAQVRRLLVAK
jgi:CheY-like chemotaxis protein